MSIFWDLVYAFDETPWDTGEVPPEVRRVTRDGTVSPPGRALDVGCGTGTNVFYLAHRGFEVTGIDVSRLAINRARRKAEEHGVAVEFHAFDVTKLHRPGSPAVGPMDFVLDIGCFHTLDGPARGDYVEMLRHVLAPEGHYLQYVHLRETDSPSASGAGSGRPRRRSLARILLQALGRTRPVRPTRQAVEEAFGRFCRLLWLEEGTEAGRPSAWSLWQRDDGEAGASGGCRRGIGWSPSSRRV